MYNKSISYELVDWSRHKHYFKSEKTHLVKFISVLLVVNIESPFF